MKISVITVSYNSAETIGDTLRSISEQRYTDIEHIVIDGGSSDATLDKVRAYGDRVAHLISEPDEGIYDAMNKGLRLASGDFIGFLNADDMLASPDSIAQIAAAVHASPARPDVIYGDLVYVDTKDPSEIVRYWRSGSYSKGRLKFGWMPPHPTFYVRRSVQQNIGFFDQSLRIAADYDFMLRCLCNPDVAVAYLPEVLVRMRLGGASNRSLRALLRKSREDLFALRQNRVGGWGSLFLKNARKLPQFVLRPDRP